MVYLLDNFRIVIPNKHKSDVDLSVERTDEDDVGNHALQLVPKISFGANVCSTQCALIGRFLKADG